MKIVAENEELVEHDETHEEAREETNSQPHGAKRMEQLLESVQSVLDELHLLEKYFSFENLRKIEKLESLENLKELSQLDQLQSLKDLAQLGDLSKLSDLENLDSLQKLEQLQELNKLSEIDKLERLEQLKELNSLDKLSDLEKLSSLGDLHKLEKLNELNKLESLNHLDSLQNLEQLQELNKLSEIDKLERLEQLKELNSLDKLSDLEKLSSLGELHKLEKLDDLDKLESLSHLDLVPRVKEDLEYIRNAIPLMEELKRLDEIKTFSKIMEEKGDTLERLHDLDNLTKLEHLQELRTLEKMDNLKELQNLSQLDRMERLTELQNLSQLEQIENLKQLDQLQQMGHLKSLENLENLEYLEELQKIDELEQITSDDNWQLLNKLDKFNILEKEKSKIYLGVGISFFLDMIKVTIMSVAIIGTFFYLSKNQEFNRMVGNMMGKDIHTANISYNMLKSAAPTSDIGLLKSSFYDKSLFEVFNYWSPQAKFDRFAQLKRLDFVYHTNPDFIPEGQKHPSEEFSFIENEKMKDMDTVINEMPETTDIEMENKAYFKQIFLSIYNKKCDHVLGKLQTSKGESFAPLENLAKSLALSCLYTQHDHKITDTLHSL